MSGRSTERMAQTSSQWVYLVRFFVGATGEVGCHVRDIAGSEAWVVADPERARTTLEVLEGTRPVARQSEGESAGRF
jgi:hypothetical protein